VLDDFLPAEAAARLLDEFPPIDAFVSDGPEGGNKVGKYDSTLVTELSPFIRNLLAQLCCSPFVDFLESLSGVSGLVPDPHGTDHALRHFVRGGSLALHADFNTQKSLGLERRVNIILYLNRNWPAEYGAALEFWDRDMTVCAKSIAPVFNRAVVFSPTSDAYHGFPDPVRCPEGESRKSLQLYYYAAPRSGVALHGTTRWHAQNSLLTRLRRRLTR